MKKIVSFAISLILLFTIRTPCIAENTKSTETKYSTFSLFVAFSELLSENLPISYSNNPRLSIEILESGLKALNIEYKKGTPYYAPALIIKNEYNESVILSCEDGYGLTMVVFSNSAYQLSTLYTSKLSYQYKDLITNKVTKYITLNQLLNSSGQTVDTDTVTAIKFLIIGRK